MSCIDKPWYYVYYDYKLHEDISVPCNSVYEKVSRTSLNSYDRELYYLHLQAVKLNKYNNSFYWQFDSSLDKKFSLLWEQVLREKHDKIN
jgi:hypothetical protein